MTGPTPEPGLYFGIPFSVYKTWNAWNPSTIKVLTSESAKAMMHERVFGREATSEMGLGTAEHVMVLQPDEFPLRYVVWDGGDKRGKAWDAFKLANTDKAIVKLDEYNVCLRMRDAVLSHAPSAELLADKADAEVSMVWVDSATGATCKGRIDWLTTDYIMDLKTARDPSPYQFTKQAVDLGYHISMGAYLDGLWSLGHQQERAHFVAVGSAGCHDVVRYDLSPASLRFGLKKWQSGLAQALECERLGSWPGCAPEPVMFELPEWAMERTADLLAISGEAIFEDEG